MEEKSGMELDADEGEAPARTSNVRKNISLKLKGKVRGRPKKSTGSTKRRSTLENEETDLISEEARAAQIAKFLLEEDITKLEAPKFTTIDRGPPEPVHHNVKLRWDYKVNLIGEKVVNPLIHYCKECNLPVLIYGRMIPCKHVFCYDCAKTKEKLCPRCNEKVSRVEQTGLGTVFMCTHGGSRYGNEGCGRTYLSQRDLHAHINHRHLRVPPSNTASTQNTATGSSSAIGKENTNKLTHSVTQDYEIGGNTTADMLSDSHSLAHVFTNRPPPSIPPAHSHAAHLHPGSHLLPDNTSGLSVPIGQTAYGLDVASLHLHRAATVAMGHGSRTSSLPTPTHNAYIQTPTMSQSPMNYGGPSPIPVMSTRTNLITVPIQDESGSSGSAQPHQGPPPHHSTQPPSVQQGQMQHHQQNPAGGIAYAVGHPPVPSPTMYSHQHPHGPPPTCIPRPPISYGNSVVSVSYASPMTTQTYIQHHQVSHFGPQSHLHPSPTSGQTTPVPRTTGAPPYPPPPPPPVHHGYSNTTTRHYQHQQPPPQQPTQTYGTAHTGWVGPAGAPPPTMRPPHPGLGQPGHGQPGHGQPGHPRPPMYL